MVRNRVLSFMSQLSANTRDSILLPGRSRSSSTPPKPVAASRATDSSQVSGLQEPSPAAQATHETRRPTTPPPPLQTADLKSGDDSGPLSHENSPASDVEPPGPLTGITPRTRNRSSSRPLSMVSTYQPPIMDINQDTIPELQPIFTFLNSHANKLYQEGYFLKLDDQNIQGRPNPDRSWTECFAQLVGNVVSLWDASELDSTRGANEVIPKFINITDATLKMVDALPTNSADEKPLQNILTISTAGKNRYLFHFNSRHALVQWTAAIRLSIFEHSTLQEAYTGALIAGKGKNLNNIGVIMERSRQKVEDWVRVRFGAGTPWKRCWCVISPPDEKEFQKQQKELKKRSPYDRSHPPVLKGDIKFYDSRKEGKKQRKATPLATITNAFSAYAIYPQAKSLIDASTLVKLEGSLTIHSNPPATTENSIFIMSETHPAVSGFETLLRFLFPAWDTFGLYGRPGRLVSSSLDQRSLMFAMPKHKRYGYLEIMDVGSLILQEGSTGWTEREWKKKFKELTATCMETVRDEPPISRRHSAAKRLSFGNAPADAAAQPRVGFAGDDSRTSSTRSRRSMSLNARAPPKSETLPSAGRRLEPIRQISHIRNASDSELASPSAGQAPVPPPHRWGDQDSRESSSMRNSPNNSAYTPTPERVSSDSEEKSRESPLRELQDINHQPSPEPVSQPPAFAHAPGQLPPRRPYHSPELRRANSRISTGTLAQLAQAGGVDAVGIQQGWTKEVRNDGGQSSASSQPERGPTPPVHGHTAFAGNNANGGYRQDVRNGQARTGNRPLPPLHTQSSKSSLNRSLGTPSPGLRGPSPSSSSSKTSGSPHMPYGQARGGPNYSSGPNHRPSPNGQFVSSQPGYSPRSFPDNPPPPPKHMDLGFERSRNGGPSNVTTSAAEHDNGIQAYPNGLNHNDSQLNPAPRPLSIPRKPIPARLDSLELQTNPEEMRPPSSGQSSNNGSFTRGIDPNILARIHTNHSTETGSIAPPPPPPHNFDFHRQNTTHTMTSSIYPDSTDSPDYTSTRAPSIASNPSAENKVERPRVGILRTVGADNAYPVDAPHQPDFGIPDVDFGPTMNLSASPQRAKTPTNPLGPLPGAASFSPARSHSPAPMRPFALPPKSEYQHSRSESTDSVRTRNVVWQPGTRANLPQGQSITAEEFVQQRAAAMSPPTNMHQRHNSAFSLSGLRTSISGPPSPMERRVHSRSGSQDLLQRPISRGPSELMTRPPSRPGDLPRSGSYGVADLPPRPSSRGAGAVLGAQSVNLSAREQEHVARVTGTPLIHMAGNKNPSSAGNGLVGEINSRQREREQMKLGYTSQSVQQAINQRQQLSYQIQQMRHQSQQQPVSYPNQQQSAPYQNQQLSASYQNLLQSPSPYGTPPPMGMYTNMGSPNNIGTPNGLPQSPGAMSAYTLSQATQSQGLGRSPAGGSTFSMAHNGYQGPFTPSSSDYVLPPGQGPPQYNHPSQAPRYPPAGRIQGYSPFQRPSYM